MKNFLCCCWLCSWRTRCSLQHHHFLLLGGCSEWKWHNPLSSALAGKVRRKWLHHFFSKWQCWLALHWRHRSECVMHDHRTVRQWGNLRVEVTTNLFLIRSHLGLLSHTLLCTESCWYFQHQVFHKYRFLLAPLHYSFYSGWLSCNSCQDKNFHPKSCLILGD